MKNSESNNMKTPQYVNNVAALKSQKILNSLSNFNLKTQTDKDAQQHRSPQNHRNDKVQLRQTWRKPRMPRNGLLPQAFHQQQKHKRNKNSQQLMSNLNKIVEHNSSKKATQFLQPIKFQKKQEDNKKKITIQNRNPLIPFFKYKQMEKKINEDLKEMNDISIDKLKNQFKPINNNIKINECITLEVIKRGHHTGTIKKMLHVPTLKLICVRQQPLNSKQSRMAIRDWISIWQSKLQNQQKNSNAFLTIYHEQFNYPEGAVSILTQYLKGGSLLNLLSFVRTLPQSVIKQILDQLIKNLSLFYQLTDMNFGGLSPSQIMFTDNGQIKLGLGLYYHFPNINSGNIYYLKSGNKANIFDFNATQYKFMKNSIEKPLNLDLQISFDIFKLGLILLECSVGSLQNFQQTNLIYDAVRYVFTEQGQKQIQRQNVCCLIHNEAYLIDIASQLQESDRTKRDKVDLSRTIQYIRFLKDRYSNQFINFICCCLKLSHSKRSSFAQICNHTYLVNYRDSDNRTVKIELKDLLKISGGYMQQNILESRTQQKLDKFLGHILHVFSGCRKQVLQELMIHQKQRILNIASQIDMNYFNLGQKLYQALGQMLKSQK